MKNTKIFYNTWALQQLPVTLKLSNQDWRFLICSDGKTTVAEIQRRLGLTDKERDASLARLCDSGLLTESALSLEDYAKATVDSPAAQAESQTLQEYLRGAETSVTASTPAAPAPSAPVAAPVVSSTPVDVPREKGLPAFSPLQKPSERALVRSMSLQAVIQFILGQSPDPTAGQLATYKVFMGIDTQLLKRNGITSLRFQDDRFITDPDLQAAIADNIKKILHVSCSDSVYSDQVSPTKSA